MKRLPLPAPRRRLGLFGAALAFATSPHAQDAAPAPSDPSAPCDAACQNANVAGQWSAQTGAPQPTIRAEADGTRKLEWHGSANAKTYHNKVRPGGPGAVNTPNNDGSFGVLSLANELRLPELDGDSASMQLAGQASDDRSLMSAYSTQVQNFSVEAHGPAYAMQFGDYAANFSQLGLQLGYRGAFLQRELGGMKVAMLLGSVADSWDSLFARATRNGQPARSRYLRDISGLHVARGIGPNLQLFGSVGFYRDREDSLAPERREQMPPPSGTRMGSLGFNYRGDALTLAGEFAHSSFDDGAREERHTSNALSVDASYRLEHGSLRAGVRRLGTAYVSLGQAVQPGIEELYVATDYSPKSWLMLTADLRRTGLHIAATEVSPERASRGLRAQLGASLQLSEWVPGLSANLQASASDQKDPLGNESKQSTGGIGLAWQHRLVSVALNLTDNSSRNPSFPQSDSDARGVQAQLGIPFGQPSGLEDGSGGWYGWSGQLALNGGVQTQTQRAIDATARFRAYGLTLQASKPGIAQFGLAIQEQTATPPGGGLTLKQRQLQFDAQRALTPSLDGKLYARWAWQNIGDPELLGSERAVGAELQYRW